MFQLVEIIKGISLEKLRKVNQQSLDIVPFIDDIFNDYEGILDGLLDFTFKYINDYHIWGYIQKEEDTIQTIKEYYERFKDSKLILTKFLDSHD